MPGKRGHEVPAGAAPSTEDPGYRAQGLSGTKGGVPGVPSPAPTCSRMPSRCHSISGAGSASTEHSRTSCPGARPTTERGPRGPIMWGGPRQAAERL